ncbi:arginine--tRNA ligase [Candidatus Micrarchaeota archaeon]|nr:arginine--tRNA ligase [Candidatus Micrarchaeota archaeon]
MYYGCEEIEEFVNDKIQDNGLPGNVYRYLEIPGNEKYGDLSMTLGFQIAKFRSTNPLSTAKDLAEELIELCDDRFDIRVIGPYVNIVFTDKYFTTILNEWERVAQIRREENRNIKVLIEYPSVNPNKPWHVGHLRNALLGDVIANVYEGLGYIVERVDYIDDLGLQVAESIYSYLYLNNRVEGKFDHWLGKEYVKIHRKMEEDKETERKIREVLRKMEGRDQEIWKDVCNVVDRCVTAQYETAFKYNIFHDYLVYESDILAELFDEGMELLKHSGTVRYEESGEYKGCYVAPTPVGDKILIRSDGTVTYTGKDVIFHLWKYGLLKKGLKFREMFVQPNGEMLFRSSVDGVEKEFGHADKVINVISSEQTYPQEVVRYVLETMGHKKAAEEFHHLAYEIVRLKEGKLSGREGSWQSYTADDLYEEAVKRAYEKVSKTYSEDERLRISKAVGLNAIRYSFLRVSPEKVIVFDWNRALNMEGDSGPYLTYAYVRTVNILKRLNEQGDEKSYKIEDEYRFNEYERRLLKHLALFRYHCWKTASELRPNVLIDYLLDLVKEFNRFYENCPVIGSSAQTKHVRTLIVKLTESVLRKGLTLLGMIPLDRM